MLNLIRGLTAPAWLVGLVRGIIEAAIIAGLQVIVLTLGTVQLPGAWAVFAPGIILLVRFAEGAADHIDPSKQRDPNA